jgi:hypothetical protein
MESEEKPSLGDIRNCLLSSLDFAEGYARVHPEYAHAVKHLSAEIKRIRSELGSPHELCAPSSSLHDIMNMLVAARVMASVMAERHSDNREALDRFVKDLKQTQEEFVRKVRPEPLVHQK